VDRVTSRSHYLLATLLIALQFVASPRLASACECGEPDLDTSLREATFVFVGSTKQLESPFGTYAYGSLMEVESVWKGNLPPTIYLVSGEYDHSDGMFTESGCDYDPEENSRYLIFATRRDTYLETWWCAGTGSWDGDQAPELFDALVAQLGPGAPPDESIDAHAPPPTLDPPYSVPTNTVPAYAAPEDPDTLADPTASQVGFSRWLLIAVLAVLMGLVVAIRSRKVENS
jgi:hypothetical protein